MNNFVYCVPKMDMGYKDLIEGFLGVRDVINIS
jgi:hypothetical protein